MAPSIADVVQTLTDSEKLLDCLEFLKGYTQSQIMMT
jgi:hypothetical protein